MAAFPIRNAVNQIGKALPHWFDRANEKEKSKPSSQLGVSL